AGGHSLLMSGPPGAGKSMLASRLPGLLPPLDRERALEVAAIHSLRHAGPAG
ncbi:MAG TPA: ATP-dependent protease, partial [Alcanivorax sp.]|nr:ATP-dependent protease [Alcanivorax sp.]